MPYGNLEKQRVQRFGSIADLKKHHCTIEEIEEYEPHIVSGTIIYAGVDYGDILAQAQAEADVILWDGGNNDTPVLPPDLHIVVADPLRVGNELTYYPGETNLRMADVVDHQQGGHAPTSPASTSCARTSVASTRRRPSSTPRRRSSSTTRSGLPANACWSSKTARR